MERREGEVCGDDVHNSPQQTSETCQCRTDNEHCKEAISQSTHTDVGESNEKGELYRLRLLNDKYLEIQEQISSLSDEMMNVLSDLEKEEEKLLPNSSLVENAIRKTIKENWPWLEPRIYITELYCSFNISITIPTYKEELPHAKYATGTRNI